MKSSQITSNVSIDDLGLNFLVQLCQELGQPYEEYNAQFIRMRRAQEAEEDNGFNFGQGGEAEGYQQQAAYQPQAGFYQQQQEPSNRTQTVAPQARQQQQQPDEDEGWGNDDLLPD